MSSSSTRLNNAPLSLAWLDHLDGLPVADHNYVPAPLGESSYLNPAIRQSSDAGPNLLSKRKRPPYSHNKCDQCRERRVKCVPETRQWPEEKCVACEKSGLPCSPVKALQEYKKQRTELAPAQNPEPVPAQNPEPVPAQNTEPHSGLESSSKELINEALAIIHWCLMVEKLFRVALEVHEAYWQRRETHSWKIRLVLRAIKYATEVFRHWSEGFLEAIWKKRDLLTSADLSIFYRATFHAKFESIILETSHLPCAVEDGKTIEPLIPTKLRGVSHPSQKLDGGAESSGCMGSLLDEDADIVTKIWGEKLLPTRFFILDLLDVYDLQAMMERVMRKLLMDPSYSDLILSQELLEYMDPIIPKVISELLHPNLLELHPSWSKKSPVCKLSTILDREKADSLGRTPLHCATDIPIYDFYTFRSWKWVLSLNLTSINTRDIFGRTPLHIACMMENSTWKPKIVSALLEANALVDIEDEDGWMAVEYVIADGAFDVLTVFQDKKGIVIEEVVSEMHQAKSKVENARLIIRDQIIAQTDSTTASGSVSSDSEQ